MHPSRQMFTMALLLLAGTAHAGVVTPPGWPGSTSVVPSTITVVGGRAGVLDARGQFHVHVARFTNPAPNASVVIDASSAPGLRLGLPGAGSAGTTDCAASIVRAFTSATGDLELALAGASSAGLGQPGPCSVQIYANGVLFGTIPVAILDLDGEGGVNIHDLSLWLTDFGTGDFIGRGDYDFSGTLGINDMSEWLSAFGDGNSSESAVLCP